MEIEFVGRELTESGYRGDSVEFFLEIKKFFNLPETGIFFMKLSNLNIGNLLFFNRKNETTLILYCFQFIWQPYSEDVLASLPAYCTAGRDI